MTTNHRRSRLAAGALLAGVALVAAACGSTKDGAGTTTTTSGSGATSTTAASTGSPGQTVTIPLQVERGSSGAAEVVVQASVGGGAPVPMLLDTGSSGVVVAASALGPDAQTTTEPAQVGYVGTAMDGVVAQATVTMGGLSTTAPIAVVSVQSAQCDTDSGKAAACSVQEAFGSGVQGIIGIGLSDGPSPASPNYSPLLQVAAPYDQGFTVELPASGSGAGSLVVGPVSAPSGAVSVPLVASTSPTYPNGAKAWAKDVQLCWTIAGASGCGPTDLDIGMSDTQVTPSQIPGLPVTGDTVTSGSKVTVTAGQGGATLSSFTAGTSPSDDLVAPNTGLGSATAFNTGVAFFFANVVGYDSANGQLLIWPQSAASSPSAV